MSTSVDSFGETLRWWRSERRYSQLQLATDAEVSTRHISFLETGKAQPSREMVVHLAGALEVPLRDRNVMLQAAGFAPVYPETSIESPAMDDVRSVLSTVIEAHQPHPAVIVNRLGDLVDANTAAAMLLVSVVAADSPAIANTVPNFNRLALHPDGIRPQARNWQAVAASTITRLEREVHHRPADRRLADLFEEMLTYPDIDALRRKPVMPTGTDLLVPLDLVTFDGDRLRLITTIATVGAPYDVTLEELRLETFFPSDESSRAVLANWAVG